MQPIFRDRQDAGRALAATLLTASSITHEPVVLALPRGGMPVAFEIAGRFRAPLDVCLAQPLEVPGSVGVIMGAVASERVLVLLDPVIQRFHVPENEITRVVRRQSRELARRERAYRADRAPASLAGRTVILVDDGLASLAAPFAAITAIRARRPERLVVAMPVACPESYRGLLGLADDVVCLEVPTPLHTVAAWYQDFSAVSDLDVRRLHERAEHRAQEWSFPH